MPWAIAVRMYVKSAAELKIPGCLNLKPPHRAMKGSLLEAVVGGAVVEGGVFEGGVFEGGVFEGAVPEGGVFEGAVFEGAVLEVAVLEVAVLEGAVLEGAVLEALLGLEMPSLWHPALRLRMTTSAGR